MLWNTSTRTNLHTNASENKSNFKQIGPNRTQVFVFFHCGTRALDDRRAIHVHSDTVNAEMSSYLVEIRVQMAREFGFTIREGHFRRQASRPTRVASLRVACLFSTSKENKTSLDVGPRVSTQQPESRGKINALSIKRTSPVRP